MTSFFSWLLQLWPYHHLSSAHQPLISIICWYNLLTFRFWDIVITSLFEFFSSLSDCSEQRLSVTFFVLGWSQPLNWESAALVLVAWCLDFVSFYQINAQHVQTIIMCLLQYRHRLVLCPPHPYRPSCGHKSESSPVGAGGAEHLDANGNFSLKMNDDLFSKLLISVVVPTVFVVPPIKTWSRAWGKCT